MPISAKCFIGDTDEAARQEARGYLADFYKLQAAHYTTDSTPGAIFRATSNSQKSSPT